MLHPVLHAAHTMPPHLYFIHTTCVIHTDRRMQCALHLTCNTDRITHTSHASYQMHIVWRTIACVCLLYLKALHVSAFCTFRHCMCLPSVPSGPERDSAPPTLQQLYIPSVPSPRSVSATAKPAVPSVRTLCTLFALFSLGALIMAPRYKRPAFEDLSLLEMIEERFCLD